MKSMGYGPDESIARDQFRQGEALFREKKYAEAVPKFHMASWCWPDSTLEEDALFLEGECYFFDDQYGKAQDAYDNLLKEHGNTRYLDTVVWRLFAIAPLLGATDAAQPHWPMTPNFTDKTRPWFDSWDNAIAAYEAIHLHDPRGPLADVAEMAIANMYFRAGRYEDAAFHYDIIRKDYPKSKYQLQAHLLGLQSKMRMYQGPIYDGQPLKDAEEIADQTLTQFRGRLGDEEANVVQNRARIVLMKAEREWAMGQYYDRKQYYARGAGVLQFPDRQLSAHPLCRTGPARAWSKFTTNPTRRPTVSNRWSNCSIARGGAMTARCRRRLPPRRTFLIGLAGLAGALCGCAATASATSRSFRRTSRPIHVPVFQSSSFRRDLGEQLTEAVVKEIEKRTPYQGRARRQRRQRAHRTHHQRDQALADRNPPGRFPRRGIRPGGERALGEPPRRRHPPVSAAEGAQRCGRCQRRVPPRPRIWPIDRLGPVAGLQTLAEQIVNLMETPW